MSFILKNCESVLEISCSGYFFKKIWWEPCIMIPVILQAVSMKIKLKQYMLLMRLPVEMIKSSHLNCNIKNLIFYVWLLKCCKSKNLYDIIYFYSIKINLYSILLYHSFFMISKYISIQSN